MPRRRRWTITATSSVLGLSRYRTYSLTNTTSFDVSPSLTLKNIVGWRKVKGHDIIDQDGTVANIIVNDGWNGAIQFSEEFQLQGKMFDNNLEWVAGGYYFKESGYDNVHTFTFKTPLVGSYTNNYYLGRNESLSAFAHLSYTLPFATRTRIFGGVRYTHDRREIDFRNRSVSATGSVTCTVVGATNSNCSLVKSVTFNEPTWDVGIDRKVGSDSLVYASVSTGYRAGGFNGRATSVASQQPFKPEKVVNYEIGSKNQFILGGAPVTVNLAAYYSDYKDIQRTVVLNGAPVGAPPVVVTSIVNAATARIWGVEGEFVVRPSPSFNANAHFSYTNARYQKFGTFDAATGTELDISNNRFMGVPPVQWGLGVNWIPMDADNGKLTLGSDISFTDKFDMNDINVPRGTTNAVGLVNANINWDNLLGSKLSASIYVKNLFDTHYISSGLLLTSALDVSQVQHGAPRVVGAMLRLNF
jgi:iron complex outermembrane receptor protein